MRVMHFDRIDLRLDGSTLRELPSGALEVQGRGAHVGLYTYHDDKGAPFVELVPPETLFDAASLATVREGAPDVTIRHPAGLVTADNWRDTSHGVWVDAWPMGDDLGVKLVVKSPEGRAMIRDAVARGDAVELSPGYEVDVIDEPGTSEHGRHDAVQRNRVYNHIALLGPGEARGGAQMRLTLDGPVCAPPGCRIQSHRVRHDGATTTPMKSTLTHKDGRSVQLDAAVVAWLAKAPKQDQIETVSITATAEGGETTELMLPLAMWEAMLGSIGAEAAAMPTAPEGMAEEVMVEDTGMEREDGLTLAAISKLIDSKLSAHTVAQRKVDARDAEVQANARKLNVDASDDRHWTQIALDAIVKASPDSATEVKRLAADARAGDAVAEGRLRERLARLALDATEPGTSSMREGTKIETKGRPKAAKTDARAPWERGVANKKGEN